MMAEQRRDSAGFSLLEVLVAIMILGVGLIMVATVFPVAGNWTRQSTEETVGQTVAQNALAIIKAKYAAAGQDLAANAPLSGTLVGTLPGLETVSLEQRAYQFGSDQPFPAAKPAVCTYFWTALARKNPAGEQMMDVYILVFHKGAAEQTFTRQGGEDGVATWSGVVGEPGYVPEAMVAAYDAAHPPMRVGEYGIGRETGTVFRLTVDGQGNSVARPAVPAADTEVWIAPAADGTGASPLVYVYQTTLSY